VLTAGWPSQRPPSGLTELWHQDVIQLSQLPRVRAHIRTVLADHHRAAPAPRERVEQFVLVADEITSNALRHGAVPVELRVSADETNWLVAVTDHAPAAPPVPAVGRAPGGGGYGLYMIADLADAHGWHSQDHSKTVWALLDPFGDGHRGSAPD
jgi:anti-sigma regulatory factor (Ser/Thr protein kinase)